MTKADLKTLVTTDEGVQAREAELRAALDRWWEQHAALVADLPSTKSLMTVRRTLLESFIAELLPVGLLNRFQLAGVIVRWWNTNQYDLRTLVAHGFTGVVDGWVTTITTAMEDSDAKSRSARPQAGPGVAAVLPGRAGCGRGAPGRTRRPDQGSG